MRAVAAILGCGVLAFVPHQAGAGPAAVVVDLADYYFYPCRVDFTRCPDAVPLRPAPQVEWPSPALISRGLVTKHFVIEGYPAETRVYRAYDWAQHIPCRTEYTLLRPPLYVGQEFIETNPWRWGPGEGCGPDYFIGPSPVRWTLTQRSTLGEPVRRRALDGSEFDASPMQVKLAGAPWMSYFWGYRLGLVETRADWQASYRDYLPADWPAFPLPANDFKLVSLPPPWEEANVFEFVNERDFPAQPGGQYFYAAGETDAAVLNSLANWRYTGNYFKSGGYVSVCRFYGGANGGPNTHFYSADATECNWLKAFNFLSYEGQTFRVNKALSLAANAPAGTQPSCPTGSKPLYRLYNNASAPGRNYVSNHRYVTQRSAVDTAVAIGWLDEGVSMCVPE